MNKLNFKGLVKSEDITNAFQQLEDEINSLVIQSNNLETATITPSNPTNKDTSPLTVDRLIKTLNPFYSGSVNTEVPINVRLFTSLPHTQTNEMIHFIPSYKALVIDAQGYPSKVLNKDGLFIGGTGKYLNYKDGIFTLDNNPPTDLNTKSWILQKIQLKDGRYILKMIEPFKALLGQQKITRSALSVPESALENGKSYFEGFRVLNEPTAGVVNTVSKGDVDIQTVSTYETGNNLVVFPSAIPMGGFQNGFSFDFTQSENGTQSPIRKFFWELKETDL